MTPTITISEWGISSYQPKAVATTIGAEMHFSSWKIFVTMDCVSEIVAST